MKRFIAAALVAALLSALLLAGCTLRPKEIRGVSYLFFTYSNGMDIDDRVEYGLNLEGGVYTATVKPEGIPWEETLSVTVDASFVSELEELLRENHVEKWHGYNKRARNIMDGIGFTCALRMENGDEVDAVGYMNWPENYGNVERGLDRLYGRLWDENQGE